MRLSALVFSAAILAAPAAALAQAWQDYPFPDAGFAVHFPARPEVTKGAYRRGDGTSVPATIYSARAENMIYTITVADFSKTAVKSDAAIAEAEKLAIGDGKVRAVVDARINSQYGRELSLKRKDGSVSMLAIFFFKNRLYQLDGKAMPPDADGGATYAMRFQQSLQFNGD